MTSRPRWLIPAVIVTAWMLLAVFSTAQRFVGTIFTGERFALFDALPYAIGQSLNWALLAPFVRLVVPRVPLRRGRVAVPLLALFATTLLIASAKLVID